MVYSQTELFKWFEHFL